MAKAAMVDDGSKQGTQIGPGGEPLDRPGYFIPPTIVRDCPEDARLVPEEQSGPGGEMGQDGLHDFTQAHIVNVVALKGA
ncbi:aldehyde dehydrogenase family protein [Phenylobacterium montanum]|uniref:Aldehyde dehydrogenase family protein n=1 Tax=Phenylobacterium montanum TaxID=2823693 RepID=A0A975G327_9CAUL|nr:aldehyde dehydrogenase family protein [Caulobacter sp. S6]QUD89662.1 aldehyde dehydrogenase family protein [Caulobacter sp. S6]